MGFSDNDSYNSTGKSELFQIIFEHGIKVTTIHVDRITTQPMIGVILIYLAYDRGKYLMIQFSTRKGLQ
jgi:hypothetical protein